MDRIGFEFKIFVNPFSQSRKEFMELKVVCGCGQKYKFDVEPVGGRMPVRVNCPVCGADGTESANHLIAEQSPLQPPPIPVATMPPAPAPMTAAAPAAGLRINRTAPTVVAAAPPPLSSPSRAAAPMRAPAAAGTKPNVEREYNVWLGILGAFLGAAVGAGLMYGFAALTGFRFPLTGTCIGLLTGFGARILARGTDMTLGAFAGAIALVATGGTLFLIYGSDLLTMFIVSMSITTLVSVSFAYRIASS